MNAVLDLLAFAWAMITYLTVTMETVLMAGFGFGDIPTPGSFIAGQMELYGQQRWNDMNVLLQWLTARFP